MRRRTTPAKRRKPSVCGKRSQISRDAAGLPTQRRERGAHEAWSRPAGIAAGEGSDLSSLGTWTDRFGCLVLLFTSLLAIPLACQRFLHTALFARFQVEGVTFHFLNDVFLLNLAFKPAQRIFKRLAFLNANLRQKNYTSKPTHDGQLSEYRNPALIFHKGQGVGFPLAGVKSRRGLCETALMPESRVIRFPKARLAYLWIGIWLPVDIQLVTGVSVEIQQEGS